MPRITYASRSFEEIFAQAERVGADNVLLNDAEVGVVLGGGGEPVSAGTVANRRWRGEFCAPVIRGANRKTQTRLADVLAERDHHLGVA
jgi:hypothetical protein